METRHSKFISSEEFELLEKTAQTFSAIKQVPIDLGIDKANSFVTSANFSHDVKGYRICVADTNDGVKHITRLEHELSHIIFDSPVWTMKHALDRIVEGTPEPPLLVKRHISKARFDVGIKKMAMTVFNIIEDERIESNWGNLYAGSKVQFGLQKSIYGKKSCTEKVTDPLYAIFCARFGRTDLLKDEFKISEKYIEEIRLCDEEASIILTADYWKKSIVPWLEKLFKEFDPKKPKKKEGKEKGDGESGDGESGTGTPRSLEDMMDDFDKPKTEDVKKRLERIKDKRDEEEPTEAQKKAIGDLRKSIDFSESHAEKSGHDEFKEQEPDKSYDPSDYTDFDKESLEEIIDSSRERQEDNNETIKAMLEEADELIPDGVMLESLKGKVVEVKRAIGNVEPDTILANNLNKLFKSIKGRYHDTIDIAGGEIDIDEFIQARIKKKGDYFIDEVVSKGLAIAIGIDCSGSMRHEAMQTARNMCGTLFKAIEGIDNVDLTVVAWSSPNHQYKLSVTEVKRYEDVQHVSTDASHCENANHMAHQYLENIVRQSRADTKLVIMITDGIPAMYTGKRHYSNEDLTILTAQAVKNTRIHGIRVLGLYLGNDDYALKFMKTMYGKDFININEMEEARRHIYRAFDRYVTGAMRSS